MEITWLPDATPRPRRLAVGEFDGVHAGHREVIRGADSVLTFEPHPRTVVAPQSAPEAADDARAEGRPDRRARRRGADRDPVRRRADAQTAQDFIDHELVERLGATQVSVGENFRFGHRAKGDAALLAGPGRVRDAGRGAGRDRRRDRLLDAHPRPDRDRRGRRGRAAARRAVRDARDRRPRRQARPHARLPDRQPRARPAHWRSPTTASTPAAPPCRALGEWTAAVSIGVRPTFVTGRGLLVEAFLLDFEGDLYGRELRLDFLERIRGEKRFDSVETLIEQMHRDVEEIARS